LGNMLLWAGIGLMAFAVLFQVVTLPVEFDASKRAMNQIQTLNIVNEKEYRHAKKVLNAAAMTYVAATAVAVEELIRLILIAKSNNLLEFKGYPSKVGILFYLPVLSGIIIYVFKEMVNMDCGFKSGKNVFRYRVGGIVLVDGKALLATNTMTGYFYILSGAVNLGEASEDAAVRVMNEKTGGNYSVSRLLTIVENFFDYEFNDTKYDFQEVIFYYLMEPREIKCPDRKNKLGGGRT